MNKFDAILLVKNEDELFRRFEISNLLGVLSPDFSGEVEPVWIEGDNCIAFGFIKGNAFEKTLGSDLGRDSEFVTEVKKILDDWSLARRDETYELAGVKTQIVCELKRVKNMRITEYQVKKAPGELNEPKLALVKKMAVNYVSDRKLDSPDKISAMMNEVFGMQDLAEEYAYMLAFDVKMNLRGVFEVCHGITNAACMPQKKIFTRALLSGATTIVLVHNHPSGNPSPSSCDVKTTEIIKKAGDLLGVDLLDHIIIGENGSYYSMLEHEDIKKK